jgi:hypothetical protein
VSAALSPENMSAAVSGASGTFDAGGLKPLGGGKVGSGPVVTPPA